MKGAAEDMCSLNCHNAGAGSTDRQPAELKSGDVFPLSVPNSFNFDAKSKNKHQL